jgi:CubicO group peptidase (beta-lactamase class C family)
MQVQCRCNLFPKLSPQAHTPRLIAALSLSGFLLTPAILISPVFAAPATPAGASDAGSAPDAKAQDTTGHRRLLETYLQAINSRDLEALKKFAAEHVSEQARRGAPAEQYAQRDAGLRDMVGGQVHLFEVVNDSNTEMLATLRVEGEFPMYLRWLWRFDAATPNVVTVHQVSPTGTPASAMPQKVSVEQLSKDLDAKLTKMAADDRFSGTVLIARDAKPVWQKAYGYADREAKTLNNLDTRFRLGSMNKMFTSVAVAQLVQAQKLKFSDTIAQILPDYPNQEVARKITVHQLLTHTSGLGDIFGPEFAQKKDSLREIKDYLPLFANQPLRFEPGQGWSYSNAGFIVLGLIVEKLSGQSYYDYVQQHIYDVAGMKSSGSTSKTDKVQNLAIGYMKPGPNAPLIPNAETLPWRGMSAGGGESTVGDLLRFDQALRQHKLLSAALTETVLGGKVPARGEGGSKYAYGFEDRLAAGGRIVGHGGGAPGMNAQLDMYWDGGYTVIVLANLDPPVVERVVNYIRDRVQ